MRPVPVFVRPGITVIVSTGNHKFNVTDAILPLAKAAIGRFLVEQNPPAALDLADRGYVLQTGRVVLKGSSDELRGSDLVRSAYQGM